MSGRVSQDHTGFGVWLGDPFHDKESEQFVARSIERAPLSLGKLSIQDDIVTYTTEDGAAHACSAVALREGGSLTLSSFWQRFRVISRRPTRASQNTTVATPEGDGANALSSPLLLPKSTKAITGESSVGVVGPRASRESTRLTLLSAPSAKHRCVSSPSSKTSTQSRTS